MKNSKLLKLIGVGVLTLGIAAAPLSLPATAQTNQDQVVENDDDDGFDWGLLGLIGLAGLAGLAGKDKKSPTVYRDPNSSSNY